MGKGSIFPISRRGVGVTIGHGCLPAVTLPALVALLPEGSVTSAGSEFL